MTKVINVSMIYFESTSLKKALKEKEFKETDEFNESDKLIIKLSFELTS